jgi:hypothetical protein
MYEITQADVLAYVAGAITNPKLRQAVEAARDTDPLVQYWFDLYDPDSDDEEVPEVFKRQATEILNEIGGGHVPSPRPTGEIVVAGRGGEEFVSEHHLAWAMAAKAGNGPPALDHSTALPAHRIDTETNTAILKYPADRIPLGVARIQVKLPDRESHELGSMLVVFRTVPRGQDEFVRVAEVRGDALGLTANRPARVHLHVIPAKVTNLSEFPLEQVRALRDACNGDSERRATVEALIGLLEAQRK